MLRFYELTTILTKLGFCATFIVNMIFINLTISYTQYITGTYRKMLVMFAATYIIINGFEMIAQPCIHNFNGGAIYFSLDDSYVFPQRFLKVTLFVYASCYVSQLFFIVIQFLFRYSTLIHHPLQKSFQGQNLILWLFCYIGTGVLYGLLTTLCLQPNDYSDEYMRWEMQSVYLRDIKDTARMIAVAYENGRIRWNVLAFLSTAFVVISIQYAIIIFCSYKMQIAMETALNNLSKRNRKLERQFFKALTVQILLPTFLITIPIGFVLLVPLLDIEISCQSGIVYALYTLYPPLDSIATMLIVEEYRNCVKKLLKDLGDYAFKEEDSRTGSIIGIAELL